MWQRHGLETFKKRLAALEQKVAAEGVILTEAQLAALDRAAARRGSADDQKALRDACQQWRTDGAHVIVSNSDTPLIRRLYKGFTLHAVSGARSINSDGNGRGKTAELLIVV